METRLIRNGVRSLALLVVFLAGSTAVRAQYNFDAGDEVVDPGCRSYQGTTYDPYTDRFVVHSGRDVQLQSAFDWDRGYVDPGSYRYVSGWQRDAYGNWVFVSGPTWTASGRAHGNLDYTRRTPVTPGVDDQRVTRVAFGLQRPVGSAPAVDHQRRTRVAFSLADPDGRRTRRAPTLR